jgi:hypothetical protein
MAVQASHDRDLLDGFVQHGSSLSISDGTSLPANEGGNHGEVVRDPMRKFAEENASLCIRLRARSVYERSAYGSNDERRDGSEDGVEFNPDQIPRVPDRQRPERLKEEERQQTCEADCGEAHVFTKGERRSNHDHEKEEKWIPWYVGL